MKIAIPLFNNRVSPRFDFAPSLLVAAIENNQIRERKEIALKGFNLFQRCSILKDLGVNTLICGGIQDFLTRSLDFTSVKVISPISGDAEEVLQRFLQGTLSPSFPPSLAVSRPRPCWRGKRRRIGCARGKKE
ncbi:MAG: NifB/NifX family molybdenum-iron cluster-binding protein [Pseudomonadota bacterium]